MSKQNGQDTMITVIRDDSPVIIQHCIKYHYLHRWPHPLSLPFGYRLVVDGQEFAPDGRLWGLVVMKKPQHLRLTDLFGYAGLPTQWQVLDLARVWINPLLQDHRPDGHANSIFSQMVGRVLRRVNRDWLDHHPPVFPGQPYHIELIISYCSRLHHLGTAYRASGFQLHSLSADHMKEVYIRRLKPPLKSRQPIQLSLFQAN